jgi:addiction module RelB/DinJ family antitoxin
METTIVIKTTKALRNDAKRLAGELGIPLTTVMNALLKQFVRERQITVSLLSVPTAEKIALWESISKEADKERGHAKEYTDVEELLHDLKLV